MSVLKLAAENAWEMDKLASYLDENYDVYALPLNKIDSELARVDKALKRGYVRPKNQANPEVAKPIMAALGGFSLGGYMASQAPPGRAVNAGLMGAALGAAAGYGLTAYGYNQEERLEKDFNRYYEDRRAKLLGLQLMRDANMI